MSYLTDDADRMNGPRDTFDSCPVGDRDIMNDEWEMACGRPKCGGPYYEYGYNSGCLGCRHCNPPDHEAKPYGWGVETWEQDAILGRARQMFICWVGSVTADSPDWIHVRDLAFRWSNFDRGLLRRSNRVWSALCEYSETHPEAVERYAAWCGRNGLAKRKK